MLVWLSENSIQIISIIASFIFGLITYIIFHKKSLVVKFDFDRLKKSEDRRITYSIDGVDVDKYYITKIKIKNNGNKEITNKDSKYIKIIPIGDHKLYFCSILHYKIGNKAKFKIKDDELLITFECLNRNEYLEFILFHSESSNYLKCENYIAGGKSKFKNANCGLTSCLVNITICSFFILFLLYVIIDSFNKKQNIIITIFLFIASAAMVFGVITNLVELIKLSKQRKLFKESSI